MRVSWATNRKGLLLHQMEGKMARIAGVDIPREKRVEISLTYIYGIGLTTSRKILERTRISPDTRVKNLTEEEVNRLAVIVACAIAIICRYAVSVPAPMRVHVVDQREL